MSALIDYLIDLVKNSWVEKGGPTVGLLTVTHAAVANRHHIICKVDASYATSTASHELRVYYNTGGSRVLVGRKHIHGAGALDFGELGLQNPTIGQAVEAELDSDASAGDITFTGYSTGPSF